MKKGPRWSGAGRIRLFLHVMGYLHDSYCTNGVAVQECRHRITEQYLTYLSNIPNLQLFIKRTFPRRNDLRRSVHTAKNLYAKNTDGEVHTAKMSYGLKSLWRIFLRLNFLTAMCPYGGKIYGKNSYGKNSYKPLYDRVIRVDMPRKLNIIKEI